MAPTPLRFTQAEHYSTNIEEQSALTSMAPHANVLFTIADDSNAVWSIEPPADAGGALRVERLSPERGVLDGLEGATYDPEARTLRVVTEDPRQLWELEVSRDGEALKVSEPVRLGTLELPLTGSEELRRNKGWEGITTMPASLSPDGAPYLIAVNEDSPRRVALFELKTLTPSGFADLPDGAEAHLSDLSDCAVGPTGTVFIVSDQGESFGEFELTKDDTAAGGWSLTLLEVTEIADPRPEAERRRRLKAEGIAFDLHGDLWVACERGKGLLVRFARQ
ncbi:MAG: hypothetical protein AAF799_20365 [Myxococcota bacterium]